MPDPRGAKRLLHLGCKILWKKTKIRVPVEVTDYEDFQPGTRYPKMKYRAIWLIYIEMPKELMDDIREGSIDLADQTIDLNDLDEAYGDDLESQDQDGTENGGDTQQSTPDMGGNVNSESPMGTM
jgi:hypothetical protein